MTDTIKKHKHLFILLVIAFVAHCFLAAIPPLNGDEAMFWEWSRHLAFGYYAHPPMTAWIVALVVKVLGLSEFTVRFGSVLLHMGTIGFVYLLALDTTGSRKKAFISTVLFVVMPLSILMGTAMTTDSSLIFFFTASVYFVRKAIIDDYKPGWYIGGVMCGGMLLSKFFAVLFFPGVFLFMLIHPAYRKQLASKEPYLATIIALIVFSPFLFWNMQNNWLTFQFNLVVRHGDSSFDLFKVLYYIGGQLAAASPLIFLVMLASLISYTFTKQTAVNRGSDAARKERDSARLISYIVLFTLLFFLLFSFKVKIGSHWPGIIYPVASVVLAAWLFMPGLKPNQRDRFRMKTFVSGILIAVLLSGTVCVLTLAPKLMPDRLVYTEKVYDEAPPLSHFFGWHEVGIRIDELITEIQPESGKLFLSSTDYALAAMLGFYTPSHPQFYLIGAGKETVHGKSLLLWAKNQKQMGDYSLFVSDFPKSYVHRMTPYFERIEQLDPLVVRDDSGRILRTFYFTLGLNYLGNEPDDFSIW